MSDSDFTPKLGRIRDPGRTEALRHAQRVLGEAVKARPLRRPSHIGPNAFKRGLAQGAVSASGLFKPGTRRVIVKARYTRQKPGELGAARAHLRYIQRDGVTREGHPGRLYDAAGDDADGQAFLGRSEHDPHQFRFIVSAEDSERLADLKPVIRDLMQQMERDLGTKLDWIAVDHFNTGHPHTHVVVRGRDDRGQDLVMARDYIGHGIRARAQDLVTLELGPETEIERIAKLTREVVQERFTLLDRNLMARAKDSPGDPVMPWQRGGFNAVLPKNAVTGNDYRGINVLSLWVTALDRGYEAGLFATYKQWASIGAQVRKGEAAAPIVFYRQLEIAREGDGTDEGDTETVRMARGYWVFAAEQVDGFTVPTALPPDPIQRIAAADAYVTATGARVVTGGSRACYRPSTDTIHMPDETCFFDGDGRTRSEAFYSVLGHELVHWSGADTRLKRTLGKRFGDDAYAMEECCAEIGAAFLCARLGIAHEPHPDHARYIHHWLKVLKEDARAIFAAAARAQEAVTYLDGLQTPAAQQSAAA